MNSININTIIRFVILILGQALVFNHINFLGSTNPYPYILFILLFPVKNDRMLFVFVSFMIGLFIDLFSDSGGIHAAASVFVGFIRPTILRFSYGALYETQNLKFNNTDFSNRVVYFSLLIAIHHLFMFSLEIFNFSNIIMILKKTLFSSIFTIILCVLISILFNGKQK